MARGEPRRVDRGALGMERELEGVEVLVGAYKAEIVARVPASDGIRVVIERQLENANLRQLGQVKVKLAHAQALEESRCAFRL